MSPVFAAGVERRELPTVVQTYLDQCEDVRGAFDQRKADYYKEKALDTWKFMNDEAREIADAYILKHTGGTWRLL